MPEALEDWAVERHNVTLSGEGRFTIRVPMWVYPPTTTAGTWTQVTQITGGMREMRFEDDGTHSWFEIDGEGQVELRGCLQQGSNACCAEGYIYGNWSMPGPPTAELRPHLPVVLIEGKSVDVAFEYTASSHWCSGRIVANGTAGAGEGTLATDHQFYCT